MKWFLFFIIFFQGILMAEIKYIDFDGKKIPVIFERDTSLPTFNLQLVFTNAGYIKDGKNIGLANVVSSIYNEGTAELGSVEFAKLLESKAISLHVANGFESFVFEVSSLKEFDDDSISLLSRLLFAPNFQPKTLSKVKTMVGGKIKRKENDFDYVANLGLNKLLFKQTPMQNGGLGDMNSLSKITLKNVKDFAKSNLTSQNLIIVCGGDIEFSELEEKIQKVLVNIEKSQKLAEDIHFWANDGQISQSEQKDTEQAYIYFGSPFFIKPDDANIHLAKVASFVLGGSGFGSRLMEEIRVKRGLAYSAYSSIAINKTNSYFSGHLQTKLASSEEATKLVKEIVGQFVSEGITQKELDGAKAFLLGSEPLRVETLSQRLNRAYSLFYKNLPQDYPQNELKLIESIKLEEINSFIKQHIEIEKLSFYTVKK